jgi:hypothetical protein
MGDGISQWVSFVLPTTTQAMAEKVDHIPPAKDSRDIGIVDQDFVSPQPRTNPLARIARILGLAAVMFLGIRTVLPPGSVYSSISQVGRAAGCGGHRKLIHDAKQRLPSHYALPSGDRIPSVALGESISLL